MDYLRGLVKSILPAKQQKEPLPTRKEMVAEQIDRFTAGYSYSINESLPDPDPILAKLGRTDWIFRELRADAKVSACIAQRKAGTLSLSWRVVPNEGQEEVAAEIEEALRRLNLPNIISECLDAVFYGFQPLEVMWEYRDGKVMPRDVVGKPAYWFTFDALNRLRFRAKGVYEGVILPQYKVILAQNQPSYENPYGTKVLSQCFWPVTFKKNGWRWWVTMVEKYGMPLVLGKVPRGTDVNEQQQMRDRLELMVQDAVAVLPNDSTVEVLAGGATANNAANSAHKVLIDQCNSEIALAIVGQTLTSEIGDNGSYAAAQTHNEVRGELVAADKRMVERALQQLVNWIYLINWGQEGKVPQFELYRDIPIDKAAEAQCSLTLMQRDKVAYEMGIDFAEQHFVEVHGFKEGSFTLRERQEQQGAEFAEPTVKRPIKAVKSTVKRPLSLDKYDLDGKKFSEFGKALVAQAIGLLDSSTSFNDVRDQLMQLYPEIDTGELEECLARAFYIAHLEGRL